MRQSVQFLQDLSSTEISADLEDLHQIANLGLWCWNVGTQEFVWSQHLYKIFGYEPRDCSPSLDFTFSRIHPEDRAPTMRRLLDSVADQKSYGKEFRVIRPNGEIRVCWAKVRPVIERDAVVRIRGVCLDITYLRQTERQAKESEENYHHFVELSPQMPWTADPQGNVLSVSARWTEITGLCVESSLGLGWLDAVHADDLEDAASLVEQAWSSEPRMDQRLRIRGVDGTYRWMRVRGYPRRDEAGQIFRWYGLTEDIHDQVMAEIKLAESEENYRYTVELSAQIPWSADADGNVTEFGSRWCELIGMGRASTLGEGWGDALHPDDFERTMALWSECQTSGEPLDIRYRLRSQDGEYRWFRARAQPRRNDGGEIIRWYGILEEIDEQVHSEEALRKAEERYRLATEATNDLIWDWDLETGYVERNRCAERFGFQTEELGTTREWWQAHTHPDDREHVMEVIREALISGSSHFECEYRFRRADGTYAMVVDRGYIVRNAEGRATRSVGAMQDLSDRKAAEEQIAWSARHDGLTELPNRRFFNERLVQALATAKANNGKVGLLHLDVDQFKQVNDALGHDAGDELLRVLATRMKQLIRHGDTIARLGGDEFALILPDIDNVEDMSVLVEALLDRMREPFSYCGRILDCRASIGASVYPRDGTTPEELLKNADIALYVAKAEDRGGMVVFEGKMRDRMRKRSAMIRRARDAIRDDRVIPYYQAKIDMHNNRNIVGFEALLRWRHQRYGIQLPKTVEAAFEDLDVAAAISDRMVQRTIEDMREWLERGIDFGHVAVNASAAEFRRNDFAERVLKTLEKAEVPASCFQLEVTETVFLGRGSEYVDRALKLLSRNGVKIALDDFGTGYASLRHLKQFPVDIIKIDQSFVRGMAANAEDRAIINAVVNLGRSMGIAVVAEGIETELQHHQLARLGCDVGQGFLYSKAVRSSRVPGLLDETMERQELNRRAVGRTTGSQRRDGAAASNPQRELKFGSRS